MNTAGTYRHTAHTHVPTPPVRTSRGGSGALPQQPTRKILAAAPARFTSALPQMSDRPGTQGSMNSSFGITSSNPSAPGSSVGPSPPSTAPSTAHGRPRHSHSTPRQLGTPPQLPADIMSVGRHSHHTPSYSSANSPTMRGAKQHSWGHDAPPPPSPGTVELSHRSNSNLLAGGSSPRRISTGSSASRTSSSDRSPAHLPDVPPSKPTAISLEFSGSMSAGSPRAGAAVSVGVSKTKRVAHTHTDSSSDYEYEDPAATMRLATQLPSAAPSAVRTAAPKRSFRAVY
eukprot:NODE_2686_length_1010_cov_61.369196_g2666_i0.p1 GENE.NODE_2686_length_1010_cov_61.369196_g2666_i0~~NODE_2686_length_1010_cov_61.369196_g2666_i0.p1  ORF type:complete len:330 (+),score=41.99 NODE_2686_length_1010_cov_61.369196_g2666_i0:134-991(+)